mmetsp:Transcript_12225/g.36476  ORF Transcript_12225/g.36476 Transcript_12225/m.36476 type:complete len:295 (-) Transcript_12225:89-973(-)
MHLSTLQRALLCAILALFCALIVRRVQGPRLGPLGRNARATQPPKRAPQHHAFTRDKLSAYSGPTYYISILGTVFDVTSAPEFYAPGKDYHNFCGRDASRAYHTGEMDTDLTDDLSGLTDEAVEGIVGWRSFYLTHHTYTVQGRLHGSAFYDERGQPTAHLLELERRAEMAERQRKQREREHHEQRRQMVELGERPCRGRASGSKRSLWCDKGPDEPTFVPRRRLAAEDSRNGGMSSLEADVSDGHVSGSAAAAFATRGCVCVELSRADHSPQLVRYEGCDRTSSLCTVVDASR